MMTALTNKGKMKKNSLIFLCSEIINSGEDAAYGTIYF